MRLKEKKLLQKFAVTLKKFSAQGAKKVEYGMCKKGGKASHSLIVIVVLLFYVHGKHLRSCRDGQLT